MLCVVCVWVIWLIYVCGNCFFNFWLVEVSLIWYGIFLKVNNLVLILLKWLLIWGLFIDFKILFVLEKVVLILGNMIF